MRVGATSRRGFVAVLVILAGVLGLTATVYAAATKPGLTVQVSPATQSVERGKAVTYTVTVSSTGGFAGTVGLTASGLPSGTTAAFAPASLTLTASGAGASATSTLTVTTASSTPVASSNLTIAATSGKTSDSVSAGLTVTYPISSSLSMTATPSSASMAPGSIAAYGLTLARTGVTGSVTFSVISGLPSGASASFSPAQTTGSSTTLQVSTTDTVADGTYTLYLVASGKDTNGTTRYAYTNVDLVINTTGRAFTIDGNLTGLLSPGVSRPLELRLTNPNKKPLSIDNLSVSITGVTRTSSAVSAGLACTAADYAVAQYTGPYPLTLPANATQSLSQLGVSSSAWPRVAMVNRNVRQDGCKGATVSLGYAGSGRGN